MLRMAESFYTDEQAQEILQMAARTSLGSGAVSRAQLLETAAELGISPEEVLRAESAFLEKQEWDEDYSAFKKAKLKKITGEISQWFSVAAFFYGIVFVTSGFSFNGLLDAWPKWPLGFWLIFTIKDVIELSLDLTVNREAAVTKWREKRAEQQEKAKEAERIDLTFSTNVKPESSTPDQSQVRT